MGKLVYVFALVELLFLSGCGFKHKKGLEVGESVVILPSKQKDMSLTNQHYSNIHITFTNGNKVITFSEQAKITAFNAAKKVVFQTSNLDLRDSWEKTNCSRNVRKHLENAYEGDALYCNDSLKLSDIVEWKVELENGKTKTATSYFTNDVSQVDNLLSITISFQ